MKKRILMLGGSAFQIPAIQCAKDKGYHVITCDYLPDNPGHEFADEYYNVSTTDKEAVLKLAQEIAIDGIVAYASDPAAPTAAYVGNKLNLPSNPYESVLTLVHKDRFRKFLSDNKFITPKAQSFSTFKDAESQFSQFGSSVMVKPIDSSGSKGVLKIQRKEDLKIAFENALQFSCKKRVLLEEVVEMDKYQIAGDGFVVDGQLVFRCFANEHFDCECNPLVPIGESFPCIFNENIQNKVHSEVQRLLTLLNMKFGALNFDIRISNGEVVLMEVGPRNGGNLIPDVIKYSTDVDLISYTIDAAMGVDCSGLKMKRTNGYYSSYMIHAQESGKLGEVYFSDVIKDKILEKTMLVKVGDEVERFDGSHQTLGTAILKFSSEKEMLSTMDSMEQHIKVKVKANIS